MVFEARGLGSTAFYIDDIQFLDTNGNEYGGTRTVQQTERDCQNYSDLFTEITAINGVSKIAGWPAFFKDANTWGMVVPINHSALRVGMRSSLPGNATPPNHILAVDPGPAELIPATGVSAGNKKNYEGELTVTVPDTATSLLVTVYSDHQYLDQYRDAFMDTVMTALDKQPPQVAVRVYSPYVGVITTETGFVVHIDASDDVGLLTLGLELQDKNGSKTTLFENALETVSLRGDTLAAIQSLGKSYQNEAVEVTGISANLAGIYAFARDWVLGPSNFRSTTSAMIPVSVYDLTDKHVTCDSYDLQVGDRVQCHLPSGIPPNSKVKVQFRNRDPGNPEEYYDFQTNVFKAKKAGTYELELLFYETVDRNPQLIRRSTQVARMVVKEGAGKKPVAVRLGESVAMVFPPEDFLCAGSGINRYKVFRKRTPETLEGQAEEVGIIGAGAMNESGFTDLNVPADANPSYAITPIFDDGREGARTPWDQTTFIAGKPTVTLDHFPLPGRPTHLQIGWKDRPSRVGTATAITGPMNPDALLVPSGEESFLGFQKPPAEGVENSGLYLSKLRLAGDILLQESNQEANLTLANTLLVNPEDRTMLELTDYDSLVDAEGERIVEQSFWLASGDLAKPELRNKHLSKALLLARALQPSRDLSQCLFEGNRFVCSGENRVPALKITIPTLQIPLAEALIQFWLDHSNPQQAGGLLLLPEWREWADNRITDLFPNASENMTDPSTLPTDPNNATLQQYALGLATHDAASLIQYGSQPGHNLFKTGSSLLLDWFPMMDEHFYRRLIVPPSQNAVGASTMATGLALSYLSLIREMEFAYHVNVFPNVPPSLRDIIKLFAMARLELAKIPIIGPLVSGGGFPKCPSYDYGTPQRGGEVLVGHPIPPEDVDQGYMLDLADRLAHIRTDQIREGADYILHLLRNEVTRRSWRTPEELEREGQIFAAAYLSPDELVFDRTYFDGHYPNFGSVYLHEGTHAANDRQFAASNPAIDYDNATWRSKTSAEKEAALHDLVILSGRWHAFTELRAHWNERVYLDQQCRGDTVEEKERAILEEDILSKSIYRITFASLGICPSIGQGCSSERDLFRDVSELTLAPWTPVGKNSPWED